MLVTHHARAPRSHEHQPQKYETCSGFAVGAQVHQGGRRRLPVVSDLRGAPGAYEGEAHAAHPRELHHAQDLKYDPPPHQSQGSPRKPPITRLAQEATNHRRVRGTESDRAQEGPSDASARPPNVGQTHS
ncbi:unnamed protein product [Boreogadus saida]